jgi:DNA-binding NtrC family response regulator
MEHQCRGNQAKLPGVLEDAPYYRSGGTRKISVDVRVIAASNQDFGEAAAEALSGAIFTTGWLRSAFHVAPAARTRRRHSFMARFFREQQEETALRFSEAGLGRYGWPGNVRELRNAVDRGRTNRATAPAGSGSTPDSGEVRRPGARDHAPVLAESGGQQVLAAEALWVEPPESVSLGTGGRQHVSQFQQHFKPKPPIN